MTEHVNMADATLVHTVLVNSASYIGALAIFYVVMKVPNVILGHFPLTGCLLVSSDKQFRNNKDFEYLFVALLSGHFLRRAIEIFFVCSSHRRLPLVESIGGPIYYWFFALWMGLALRHDNGYRQTYLSLVVLGSITFLIGQCCNSYRKCRAFRVITGQENEENSLPQNSPRVISHGSLFEYLSCAYFCSEIFSWFGFFLASWVLPAVVFLVVTPLLTLLTYLYRKRKASQTSEGLEGRERCNENRWRALIPMFF